MTSNATIGRDTRSPRVGRTRALPAPALGHQHRFDPRRRADRRGTLYHHFADKAALFEAVCSAISEEALPAVEAAAAAARTPLDALVRGSIAWIDFVTRADMRHILLVDGPTVLRSERCDAARFAG